MSSCVYHNVLTVEEINSILEFYQPQADAHTEQWVVNKNLEYHIPDNFIYKLLNPKLTALIGEHEFATGSYKECIKPYPIHVDTYEAHDNIGATTFATDKQHNLAMLIPLVEGPEFKTVTFKLYSNKNNFYPIPQEWLTEETNSLDVAEFDHDGAAEFFPRLPLDVEYSWKLGDILTWDRNQLHVSANFARNGAIKKFLVLFIA